MPSSTTSSERTRVLVVDDNEVLLTRAAAILALSCAVVGTVTDGPTALKAAEALQPDIIVLDISMPGMTGLEVARRLRSAGSTAALVFLTVHDGEEFISAARSAGAIGYVVKSRLLTDLPFAVREACQGRQFVSAVH